MWRGKDSAKKGERQEDGCPLVRTKLMLVLEEEGERQKIEML